MNICYFFGVFPSNHTLCPHSVRNLLQTGPLVPFGRALSVDSLEAVILLPGRRQRSESGRTRPANPYFGL